MWFLWKGVDSRTMNLWVSELPAVTRAAERYEEVTIPGRPGTLQLKQGDNVHEGYVKECTVTAPSTADFEAVLTWLSGEGDAVFANEPDRVYRATINGEVKFTRNGNSLRVAVIPFFVHPHKGQYPPETDLEIDSGDTLTNPGTVDAKPLITITGTGEIAFTVDGDESFAITLDDQDEETVTVDCDAEIITSGGEIWLGAFTTPFIQLPPGDSVLAWTGDAEVTVKPRWRWF